ncbi:hypothetical protein P879_05669 [Paragonimus westermani]|uniref:Uncharacterized protein n=1 Tax=Paragonimus westermani TaxID=34504 RepID=A0A8T0DEW8_9TREM|nr:hypothetical protein P879_05669 [Paragonimus westermani]
MIAVGATRFILFVIIPSMLRVHPFSMGFEINVRLASNVADTRSPCEQLESRAPEYWSNGVFSHCQFQGTVEISNGKREHMFNISVGDDLIPEVSGEEMIYFAVAYFTNKVLNTDSWDCRTVVGIGQPNDTYTRIKVMDDIPLQEFILTTPTEQNICQKIVGKRYVEDQIKVEECHFLRSETIHFDGQHVGKYRLRIDKRLKYSKPMQANSIYTHFIRELNFKYGRCDFNGYWAPFVSPSCK